MKTKMIFLIFVLGITLKSNGQLHPTVRPLNENGYSVEEFKNSVLGSDQYSMNIYENLIEIINLGLVTSGESANFTEYPLVSGRHDDWIFEHIYVDYDVDLPNGYRNSYRDGNEIKFFWDKKPFKGPCFVFKYGNCKIILGKTTCMNLFKIPILRDQASPVKSVEVKSIVYKPKKTDELIGGDKSKYVDPLPLESTETEKSILNEEDDPVNLNLPPIETKRSVDWVKIAKIGGVAVVTGAGGYLLYSLLSPKSSSTPNNTGGRVTPGSHPSTGGGK